MKYLLLPLLLLVSCTASVQETTQVTVTSCNPACDEGQECYETVGCVTICERHGDCAQGEVCGVTKELRKDEYVEYMRTCEKAVYTTSPDWEACVGENYPCVLRKEIPTDYNYCQFSTDCILAPKPTCECPVPNTPGEAVSKGKLQQYKEVKASACLGVQPDCPVYTPSAITYKHDTRCIDNVCRVIRTGVA